MAEMMMEKWFLLCQSKMKRFGFYSLKSCKLVPIGSLSAVSDFISPDILFSTGWINYCNLSLNSNHFSLPLSICNGGYWHKYFRNIYTMKIGAAFKTHKYTYFSIVTNAIHQEYNTAYKHKWGKAYSKTCVVILQ